MRGLSAVLVAAILAATPVSSSWAAPDVEMVDTETLHAMVVDNAYKLEGGGSVQHIIIDTRPEEEFASSHIFAAINVPVERIGNSLDALPSDKTVRLTLYANDTDLHTCLQWATLASTYGYHNIAVYSDVFQKWKEAKLPVQPL